MKPLRSFLFVPGDSEKKLGKIEGSPADAIILDLEDSVSPSRKAAARRMVADYLRGAAKDGARPQLWVRINPLDSGEALADLAAVVSASPSGIMTPKVDGPTQVQQIAHYLDALEAAHGQPAGQIRLLPVATETAAAPFRLGDFAGARIERLYGLTWGAEDLSAALGASTNLGPDGHWALTYQVVRSLTLMGARAAGVEAVETLYADIKDTQGLALSCRQAYSEGFSGRIAVHPAQVEVINEAFTPSAAQVEFARQVVAAFEGEIGTVAIEGKMLDLPHLKQAQRVLSLAD